MKKIQKNEKPLHSDDPKSHPGRHRTWITVLTSVGVLATIGLGVWGIVITVINRREDNRPKVVFTNTPRIVYKVGEQSLLSYLPITNQGLTDAVNVTDQVSYLKFPKNTAESEIQKDLSIARDRLPFKADAPIVAHVSRDLEAHTPEPFSLSEKTAVHEGEELLYLTATVKYNDSHGKSYSTNACYKVAGGPSVPSDIRGLFIFCPFGSSSD